MGCEGNSLKANAIQSIILNLVDRFMGEGSRGACNLFLVDEYRSGW